ncbi:MAG TPA: type III pantothenate kinase, partial [Segetibacter sp.]|nr:type III pantothenate kinase [Segetibacter sp.]
MTTLCFDFGNTRLKCGVFINRDFAEEVLLRNDSAEELESIIKKYQPQRSILSSVVDHNLAVEELLKNKTSFHKLSYDSKLPVTSPVGKPHTIGADRLAMVVAVVDRYPRRHNLVIGLGTCITYNFVNKYHQ